MFLLRYELCLMMVSDRSQAMVLFSRLNRRNVFCPKHDFSNFFSAVKIGENQSAIMLNLFSIVLEASSSEFRKDFHT